MIRKSLGLFLIGGAMGLSAEPLPKELRIGMIGLDTSHVTTYLQIFNDPQSAQHVPGAKIVAAFKGGSPDIELSRSLIDGLTKMAEDKYRVKLYASIEELSASVDALIIFSVDGRPHIDQFRRTLAAQKPVFIDKPLAGSLRDAVEIARLSRATGVPVFSCSSLRYSPNSPARTLDKIGTVNSAFAFSPGEIEPHHPDLFWYGIHAVEALYTVLGPGCVRLVRTHTANTDVVTGIWFDGRVGTVQANRGSRSGFGITAFGAKGMLSGGERPGYKELAQDMLLFFRTGLSPVPLEATVEMLAFMEAADESKRRDGAPVILAEVLKGAGLDR